MPDFCEHLEDYGVQYVRVEAAYGALLAQVERVVSGRADDTALDLLERLTLDWRDEVNDLRRRMVEMVRHGRADAPDDDGSAVRCCLCGAELPRLEFGDLAVGPEGALALRGQPLTAPAAV